MSRVVCIGDIMMDVLADLPAPLAVGSDQPAPIVLRHGGSAANTAAWLAREAVEVSFVGRVGADSFGRELVAGLATTGVRPIVAIDPSEATGVCVVLVHPDGQRSMIPSAGANGRLSVADLPSGLLTPDDHLHLSAYSLLNPGSRDAARAALRSAVDAGATVSVDVASADPIRLAGAETVLGWVPAAATLIANRDEAEVLTGIADPRVAAAKLGMRFASVVVKCGRLGAVFATPDEVDIVRAEPVDVLDSTGAGDAFAAGYLAARTRGASVANAIVEGNRLGAQAVQQIGARP